MTLIKFLPAAFVLAGLAACGGDGPPLVDLKVPPRPKSDEVIQIVEPNAPGARWMQSGTSLVRALDGAQTVELPSGGGMVVAQFDEPVVAGRPKTVTFLAWAEKPVEARIIFVRSCKNAEDDGVVLMANLTPEPQAIRIAHTFQHDFPCTQLQLQAKGATIHLGPAVLTEE